MSEKEPRVKRFTLWETLSDSFYTEVLKHYDESANDVEDAPSLSSDAVAAINSGNR